MKSEMKIAIFGGAFDPPHLGHANLVRTVRDIINPDRTIIIPTGNAPHKTTETPFEHRFAMAKSAFPDCEVSDMENNEKESYTVDTVRELRRLYPDSKLILILGADAFESFSSWKDYEQILELCHIIAGGRDGISSRLIREKLSKGEKTEHLLDGKVAEYIKNRRLYGL